jgi:hypothetical protein
METRGTSPALGDREKGALGAPHGQSPLGQNEMSQSQFRMIDIAEKKDTQRRAVASALFLGGSIDDRTDLEPKLAERRCAGSC